MKPTFLFLILFFLFLLEGTVMQVYTPMWHGEPIPVVPYFVFIALLMVGLISKRQYAMIYSMIFGLLTDIVDTDLLGVYLFVFTLAIYLITSLKKIFHINLLVVLLLCLIGVLLVEFQVYGLYLLINRVSLSFTKFIEWRLPPVLILNGAFVILIYYPFRKFLLNLEGENTEE